MGLREFWSRLTGGDREERIEEQLRDEGAEQPDEPGDYEAMKDDAAVDEHFRAERVDPDSDE
jgi:hypothetical protein